MEQYEHLAVDRKILYKNFDENGAIEYEFFPAFHSTDDRFTDIKNELERIQTALDENQENLDVLKVDIDKNTSHADRTDCIIAACCGAMASLLDIFFVGEFNFRDAKAWSNEKVNRFVENIAEKTGYKGEGRLKGAIKYLEDKYKVPNDSSYNNTGIRVNSKSHHLDDFAHHPTIVGLIFSILTQFTGNAYFSNIDGEFYPVSANEEEIGYTFEDKIFRGTVTWFLHLVSDISGSNKTAGAGMGVPGPIVSFAKELSSLPIIKETDLSKKINRIYQKEHFDLRSEIAVARELARQSVPVIVNEVLVRTFYFIRRFFAEYGEKKEFSRMCWEKVLPFNNPTIVRMITIASGTFLTIDAGHAILNSGGTITTFVLNINIVNVFRFSIALWSEGKYTIKRENLGDEYYKRLTERNALQNLKIDYQQYAILLVAKDTLKAISDSYSAFCDYAEEYREQNYNIETKLDTLKKNLNVGSERGCEKTMTLDEKIAYLKKNIY